jgi:heme exporter protein A
MAILAPGPDGGQLGPDGLACRLSIPMSPSPPPAVQTSDLYRRYGRHWALAGLNLTVPAGTSLMLAGPNGSGKSTLLQVLSGALRPTLGSARVGGLDVTRERTEVRRQVAILAHHLHCYRALSALENLQITARLLAAPAARRDLQPLLQRVRLGQRADDPVATFSAGMRKRLALARVLLQVERVGGSGSGAGASVVLLDEPYGELDADGFRFVDGFLEELAERGVTTLMATHLLDRGARFCDQALLLQEGSMVWHGRAGELPGLETGFVGQARAGGLA